jgi:hypothetical protein
MATKRYKAFDRLVGAQPAGAKYCMIKTDGVHSLQSARIKFGNIVGTGTLTVTLKSGDHKDNSSGRVVGTALTNSDLLPSGLDVTSQINEYEFTLDAGDTATAPAGRYYWVELNGDNAADRLDEPLLEITVNE